MSRTKPGDNPFSKWKILRTFSEHPHTSPSGHRGRGAARLVLLTALLLLVGAREADAQTPSLTVTSLTATTATLTLANHSTA